MDAPIWDVCLDALSKITDVFNNTPLWPLVQLDGRSGRPDLINRLVMPSSRANNIFCLHFIPGNIYVLTFAFVALGAVARVNWVISCFNCPSISTMYPWHECLVGIRSIMSPCWARWWVGSMVDET